MAGLAYFSGGMAWIGLDYWRDGGIDQAMAGRGICIFSWRDSGIGLDYWRDGGIEDNGGMRDLYIFMAGRRDWHLYITKLLKLYKKVKQSETYLHRVEYALHLETY